MRNWIDLHAQAIAGGVAAIVTLFLMANAETGGEAVACLFTAPICFGLVMAVIEGITD
jgi:hypothetical protein